MTFDEDFADMIDKENDAHLEALRAAEVQPPRPPTIKVWTTTNQNSRATQTEVAATTHKSK
jgi:hypothetical protein